MGIDKTTCWLLMLFRTTLILLGLDLPSDTHPFTFYPWKVSARHHFLQTNSEAPQINPSVPIRYRLDAWSQYDNPEEGNAREGDIRDHPLSRKTTTTDQELLWPDGVVPYFVDELIVNQPEKFAILEDAMKNIMELTCLKFVRIYPNSKGKFPLHSWVNITGNQQGCFSDLGRSTFGPSNLNLDVRRCFRTRGHALHEILHTLGFFHEHMRPDRDEHIQILWDNIKEGDVFNFRMMDDNAVTNYGLPYDYESIMHYSMTAFSKNKSIPTIVPRKYGVEIGQRNHLSFNDVQKLLITYKCNNVNTDYVYEKMKQERVKSSTDHLGLSVNTLRDYQPLYPKEIYRKNIRTIWEPSYDYYYQEYFSNPFVINYYYYYYYHYV